MSDLLKMKPSNKAYIVSSLDAYNSNTGPYSSRDGDLGGVKGGVTGGNAGTGALYVFYCPLVSTSATIAAAFHIT